MRKTIGDSIAPLIYLKLTLQPSPENRSTFGRYDDTKSASEQIDLMSTILSRFDLIFLVRDVRDEDRDRMICRHVMGVHIGNSGAGGGSGGAGGGADLAAMANGGADGGLPAAGMLGGDSLGQAG